MINDYSISIHHSNDIRLLMSNFSKLAMEIINFEDYIEIFTHKRLLIKITKFDYIYVENNMLLKVKTNCEIEMSNDAIQFSYDVWIDGEICIKIGGKYGKNVVDVCELIVPFQ